MYTEENDSYVTEFVQPYYQVFEQAREVWVMNEDEDATGATETGEKKDAAVEGQNMVCFLKIINFREGH